MYSPTLYRKGLTKRTLEQVGVPLQAYGSIVLCVSPPRDDVRAISVQQQPSAGGYGVHTTPPMQVVPPLIRSCFLFLHPACAYCLLYTTL